MPARVHHGAVGPALGDAAAAARPELERRHLRHLFHRDQRVPDRMLGRQLDDRVAVAGQHLPDLFGPLLAGAGAPVVRREDEAPLEQILAQLQHLVVSEARGPAVFHQDVGALEQIGIAGRYGDVVGVAALVAGHARLGELAQADADVEIGAGVVGAPAALLAVVAREHQPAVVEAVAEGRRGWVLRRGVEPEPAAPHLRVRCARGQREHSEDPERPPHTPPSIPPALPRVCLPRSVQ